MSSICFAVRGVPVPQGSLVRSPAGGLYHGGGSRLALWRGAVRAQAQVAMGERSPLAGPLAVIVEATFARPRSHYRSGRHSGELRADAPECHAQAPDVDKVARALLDALAGVVYRDDRQVVGLVASRHWGDVPGVALRVFDLDSEP